MKIKTTLGKERLESIAFGEVVMYKAFHCIVVEGPFNHDAVQLPIVRLSDGKLLSVPKKEELHIVKDVYLATDLVD